MLIAQISDCHVTAQGELAYGRVDTSCLLRQAATAIKALPAAPDLILATGDLAQSGEAREYAVLLDILADIGVPVLPVAGNHDDRETLARVFNLRARFDVQPGFIQYAFEDCPLRLIVLDSITPGSAEPSYCGARLDWLAARLAKDSRPTILAIHHPPFPAGVAWMEPKDPDWAVPLAALMAGRTNIPRLVCGHVHRSMTAAWAGLTAMSAPSTAHQVFPDLAPAPRRRFNFEAPGFLLHQWTGTQLISYGVTIPGVTDTFDL